MKQCDRPAKVLVTDRMGRDLMEMPYCAWHAIDPPRACLANQFHPVDAPRPPGGMFA